MRIVCDCDLVIAPADVDWLYWLNAVSGRDVKLETNVKEANYDLAYYFPDFKDEFGIDPHSFWDNSHLYDTMGVVKGSDKVLNSIIGDFGNSISIASHTKGGHFSSKYKYLKRKLHNVDFGRGTGNGFFATKEKYLLPCDVAIDDRAENLVLFPDNVLKIYLNTIYKDPYLDELNKLTNVYITSIKTPWEDIESVLRYASGKEEK